MKLHHFYCELFSENFYFSQASDVNALWNQIKSQLNIELPIPGDAPKIPLGVCFELPNAGIVIWIPNNKYKTISKTEILVHESSHAANKLLTNLGINDDETRSYLVQYIFKNCFKVLKGK